MSKTDIIDRLVKHALDKQVPGGKEHAEFLQVREEAMTAMKAGYKVRPIWDLLYTEGRIHMTYQTFLKYMKNHAPTKSHPKLHRTNLHDVSIEPPAQKRFVYTAPNRDELLKPSSE